MGNKITFYYNVCKHPLLIQVSSIGTEKRCKEMLIHFNIKLHFLHLTISLLSYLINIYKV